MPHVSTWLAMLILLGGAAGLWAEDPRSEEFFEKRVRPVLAGVCFRCHGGQQVAGKLRIDSREALLKGGESGPVIDSEKPERSLMLAAIRREKEVEAMPPDKALPPGQVADLTAWIKAGSPWPKKTERFELARHWAFHPLAKPPRPKVRDEAWVRSELDRFILTRLEAENRRPAPPADRRTLLRRMTYDVTGLPPTPEEVAAFEQDQSPEAVKKVVERLLASPHYGEQWGRHWLDVVRYADTAGENSDHPLPHAWRYRNWVIAALNADQPYDDFLRDQIAGDLRATSGPPEKAGDRIVATGYLAIARRFGHDIDKDMHLTLEDTLDTLGKSVLGLSIGCARCHDHKFDPLTARDYYGLYGIFESTRFAFPGCEPQQQPRDLVRLPLPAESEQRAKQIDAQVAAIEAELKEIAAEQAKAGQQFRDLAASSRVVLSEGVIDDGQAATFESGRKEMLTERAVKQGEVLLLTVGPRGNHGADTTLVELAITEVGGKSQAWSTGDLLGDLTAGNPHADAHGHADVWAFLDLKEGPRLLPESLAEVSGRRDLRAWRNGDTPSVLVNMSDQKVKVWTELPAKTFFVHPGPQGPVGVAWISPLDGVVSIAGRVADAHPGGPDGVSWQLEHLASAEIGRALLAPAKSRAKQAGITKRVAELKASRPATPVAYAVAEGKPQNARLHRRGEPSDLGDEVPRKFLDVLGGQKLAATAGSGRLELAEWLTDPANPLTPRVIVNRVWQWHFGRGLVATPNDFGTRGTPPTHPELLDHLAADFVASGWSLKALHRKILTSAAYQQASRGSAFAPLCDSFVRRRLSAEELRDTLLAASGELDRVPGAAHPFPAEATWGFTQHAPFAAEYDTLKRSVYIMQKRNRRSRFFTLFDGSDPNASTPERDVTTVPTQALFFLNDPFVHARAKAFAARIVAAGKDDRERLDVALRILVGRKASDNEHREAGEFLKDYIAASVDRPEAERLALAWEAQGRVLFASSEVLYVD